MILQVLMYFSFHNAYCDCDAAFSLFYVHCFAYFFDGEHAAVCLLGFDIHRISVLVRVFQTLEVQPSLRYKPEWQ